MSRRLATLAAAAVLGTGALTGCGVTETGFNPGVAAEVGDSRITLAEVDEVATSLCNVLGTAAEQEGQAQTLPGSALRDAAQRGLTLVAMSDQLLAEYDAELGATYQDLAPQVKLSYGLADPEDLAAAMPAFTADAYLSATLDAIGRTEVGADAENEAAITAGVELAHVWQDSVDIRTNPAFSSVRIGDTQIEMDRADLSVATSDFATQVLGEDQTWAVSLPESQRCG